MVNDVGWNLKIIDKYNNWSSKGEKKEIHHLKRQYLRCYDYCKTAFDEKIVWRRDEE